MTAAVTVIIPTYRRPASLRRALESVQRQSFGDWQACVYDNASNDDTASVVAERAAHDPRIKYHAHAANIGGLANFVFGMSQVSTPYFSFLSDDDFLYPDFLAHAIEGLKAHPDAMLFAGSTLELSDNGELLYAPVSLWPREGKYDPPHGAWQMLGNKHPTWTSVLFRREVIGAVGLLDSHVGQPSDLEYELRVAARFPIVVSYAVCAAYVRHGGANSAHEDSTVYAGYRLMAEKFGRDQTLAPPVRKHLAAALRRQGRLKLVEISVKSLVRGDDAKAGDAARTLRGDHPLGGAFLGAMVAMCEKVPPMRMLLAGAERARLRRRARRARRGAVNAKPDAQDAS
jgi:GT2 family glycosyltransferase